jgi:hypothetical protein
MLISLYEKNAILYISVNKYFIIQYFYKKNLVFSKIIKSTKELNN